MSKQAKLSIVAVHLDKLKHDPKNARTHSERNIRAIADSLDQFGQRKPVVVQKSGMIVRAGNGLVDAARLLGWSSVAAHVVDEDDVQAMAYAIADNRTGDLSEWNDKTLAEVLSGLQVAGVDLDMVGFTDDELDALIDDGAKEEGVPAKVRFSEIIGESNNYIVLTFGSDIDWLQAHTVFGLESRTSKRANGKPWSTGVGRVMDGAKAIAKMQGGGL